MFQHNTQVNLEGAHIQYRGTDDRSNIRGVWVGWKIYKCGELWGVGVQNLVHVSWGRANSFMPFPTTLLPIL